MPNNPKKQTIDPFLWKGSVSVDCLDGQAARLIVAHYSEPHRHYHTLAHIVVCQELLSATDHASLELRLAIVYHDIIYDTHRSDNEAESAKLA